MNAAPRSTPMLPPPADAPQAVSFRPTPVPSFLGISAALRAVTGQATSGTIRPGSR